jgi:hypothetical protein
MPSGPDPDQLYTSKTSDRNQLTQYELGEYYQLVVKVSSLVNCNLHLSRSCFVDSVPP